MSQKKNQIHLTFFRTMHTIINKAIHEVRVERHDKQLYCSCDEPIRLTAKNGEWTIESDPSASGVTFRTGGGITVSGNISMSCVNGVTTINGVRCNSLEEYARLQESKKPAGPTPGFKKVWEITDTCLFCVKVVGSGDVIFRETNCFQPNCTIHTSSSGKISLTSEQFDTITLLCTGSGDIQLDEVGITRMLVINKTSSGDVSVINEEKCANMSKIDVEGSGSGDTKIRGCHAETLMVQNRSSGGLDLQCSDRDFIWKDVVVSLSGSGDARLDITTQQAKLITRSSGGIESCRCLDVAELSCNGSGDIRVSCSKTCTVSKETRSSGRITVRSFDTKRKITHVPSDAPPAYSAPPPPYSE